MALEQRGGAALEYRDAAQEFLAVVTEQAHDMERSLQRQSALLESLVGSAEIALARPSPERVFSPMTTTTPVAVPAT